MTMPIIEIHDLLCRFPVGSAAWAFLRRRPQSAIVAVDHVSLAVERGSAVGVVGESGCGKSTLARSILGLVEPTGGTILLDGAPVGRRRDAATARRIQMVFQDPGTSLNPKMTIGAALAEMVVAHDLRPEGEVEQRCRELLDLVELPASTLGALPGDLSGGQRQRAAIARALALEPDVLIADEAVAALDVSVQASILNLFNRLRRELGLTLVFISHDLAVVRQVTDRVLVCYLGRVVEDQPTDQLFDNPQHPYTRGLLAAAPRLDRSAPPGRSGLTGDLPTSNDIDLGCRFRSRCPIAEPRCAEVEPVLVELGAGRQVACHLV